MSDLFYTFLAVSTILPAWAQSIWGGRLCGAFQYVVNNELIAFIAMVASAGAIIMWMLDDGKSNIKLNALRIAAGLGAIVGIPTVIAMASGFNVACSIGL